MTDAIAIVGMGCRFPGSPDVPSFWRTIRNGVVRAREIPGERWDTGAFYSPKQRSHDKTYARKLGSIDDLEAFAPRFFGIPPRRAQLMDPQQRLFLDVVRAALEDAGYAARPFPIRRTGVYAGVSVSEHHHLTTLGIHATQLAQGNFGSVDQSVSEAIAPAIANIPPLGPYSMVGQMLNMTAANVAQAFDFTGPVFATDAACSSALVALAEAMLHLRAGVADAAVVGGVYLACAPDNLVAFARIGALSASDACRPFDRRADGFVLGEGVGALVLKRLEDARRDGDRVWALLRGAGITNDGHAEGPMTPRQSGQELALRLAYEDAGVSPDTIGFVEAHGTATPAGDIAEAGSLLAVYSELGERPIDTFIGSVKANIGHTIAAAGAAGTIKAALALAHRTIPPHAGFEVARPELGLEQAGVHIPTRALAWERRSDLPRRAAVSSFGFGGTNVHIVLEEAPAAERIRHASGPRRLRGERGASGAVTPQPLPELFVVSAPTPALLSRHLRALRAEVSDPDAPPLADIAYTLSRRRQERARVAFSAADQTELCERLDAAAAIVAGESAATDGVWFAPGPRAAGERVAFLFPGQGAQVVNLCRDAAERWPRFRTRLQALARAADPLLPRPLLSYLHPDIADAAARAHAEEELTRTAICQPALAALELALAGFVEELGVTPDVLLGHSLGEIVAAAAGGAMRPADAVTLVGERGRLMEELALPDRGAMAAVAADADTIRRHLGDDRLVIANINHPRQTVVSGETEALDAFERWCADAGVRVTRLRVSHAFHSPLLEALAAPLADLLRRQSVAAPERTVISCVDVGPYPRDPDAIRDLLRRHAVSVVDFAGGVRAAWRAGARVFVQVGTGNTLLSMARSTLAADGDTPHALVALASAENRRGRDVLDGLAALVGAGVTLLAEPLYEGRGVRLCALPPSPLETQRYWLFPPRQQRAATSAAERPAAEAAPAPAVPDQPENRPAPPRQHQRPDGGGARPVEAVIRELVSRVTAMPVESIEPEMRLGGDLGFDSLMAVELSMLVSDEFSSVGELPRSLLRDSATVADVVAHVRAHAGSGPVAEPHPAADRDAGIRRYRVELMPRPLPRAPGSARPALAHSVVVVLTGDRDLARAAAARLRGAGARPVIAAAEAEARLGSADAIADLRFVSSAASRGAAPPLTAESVRRPVLAALATVRAAATAGRRPSYLAVGSGASAAGLGGFAAALAREWPETPVKAVEVEPELAPDAIATIVCAELETTDREPRVHYGGGQRRVAALVPSRIDDAGAAGIREGMVVAISGGGRGLGAVLARALAARHRARLLLLGRSAADEHTASLVRDLEAAGGRALYRCCDVTDAEAVDAALSAARAELGPIEAVVHAAGVTSDGAVDRKQDADAARVVDTKVAGALALWNAAAADPLRAFVMYSSWAGRFGNAYQTDYAAGNSALAWLAPALARTRPGTGVVALDLPPWRGSGMIERLPEPVRRQLGARAPFVDDDTGVANVLAELSAAAGGAPSGEVLLGDDHTAMPREDVAALALDPVAPHLADHRVAGVPVLPMAAALDAVVEAAARMGVTAGPGRAIAALRLEVGEGVSVPPGGATLIVTARADQRAGELGPIEVTLERDTGARERRVLGYRARATLVDGALPALALPPGGRPPPLPVADFYARHSFHGPRMRGIVRIDEVGPGHIAGVVKSAGRGELPRGGVDVLAVDAALQMCGYYTRVTRSAGALPVEIGEARVLGPIPAGASLRCVAVVDEAGERVMSGGVDLLDDGGRALVQLRGVRAKLTEAAAQRAGKPDRGADKPRSTYVIEEFPEVRALAERIRAAESMGVRNPYFNVHERVTNETSLIAGREFINFASYNYLGLSGDEDVNRAAKAAIDRYGTSVSASRIVSGEKPLHRELERALADFLGCEDAVVMVSGHATNVSIIGQLVGPGDVVLHDSLAHDSIIGGTRMSGVRRQPFPHNDMEALDRLLAQIRPNARRVLIAVEGVYSMDGDVATLDELVELKRRHHALLYVDEAHSIGVLGDTGRGIGEHFGVDRRDVDVWMGTLSKSLASCGGYIAGSRALIQLLKYTNPGFVYSVGMPPPSAAAALAALEKIRREPERVRTLHDRSLLFLALLRARGIDTGLAEGVAVVPCIVPNSWDCMRLSQSLYERGINAQPIIHPAVDEEQARVRFFITARHTEQQLITTADAVREALLGIDPRHLNAPAQPTASSALSTRQARTAP